MNRTWETRAARDQRRYTPAVHSKPVFTDPSGRRRRAMRRIGLVSAAALAICLGAVVVAMAGGPAAPFTDSPAPRPLRLAVLRPGPPPLTRRWAAPHHRSPPTRPAALRPGTPCRRAREAPMASSQPGPALADPGWTGIPGPSRR